MQYTLPGIICVIHLFTDSEKSPDRISTKQCFLYDTRQYTDLDKLRNIATAGRSRILFVAGPDYRNGDLRTGFHFRKTPHGHNPIPLTGFALPGHRTLYIVRPLPYEFSQPDGSLYFSSGNARQVTGNIAKHAPAKKKDDFRTKAMGGFQRPAPSTQQQRNTILLPDIGEQNPRRDS